MGGNPWRKPWPGHPTMQHPSRRVFLCDLGMGFTGLALGAMLHRDAGAAAPPARAKAKSVIWIFLSGGYSHLETFDHKPALNRYAGKTFAQTPYADPLKSPLHDKRSRSVVNDAINVRDRYATVYPLQAKFQKYGKSRI